MINIIINKSANILVYLLCQIRTSFWRMLVKKMGKRVDIMDSVVIMSPKKTEIGHDVLLNSGTKIGAQAGVKIGNYVQLSYNVNIVSVNHSYSNPLLPIKKQGFHGSMINIKDDVWVGANAVIMPGVTIGRGAIVGANAVVTKNVEPYTVVAGVPAKVIKSRFNKSDINRAMKVNLN